MTDIMTSQNIDLSSWDTLYNLSYRLQGRLIGEWINMYHTSKETQHFELYCIEHSTASLTSNVLSMVNGNIIVFGMRRRVV